MKRYLIILALCGAAHAGDDDIWERLRENSRQTEITNRLDEIKRQQEEILQAQRNVAERANE